MNGGIKPENLKGHRVTLLQLVERRQLTQIEGPAVILAIKLKIKLNQKVTLIRFLGLNWNSYFLLQYLWDSLF